ncbi:CLUMA_CG001550, isoform A [Clunio marinus]|uniref:CLUMA_CG001550, isoform A n=1 Tax=Clunio marinus TaxID=568069 RepID=A0A1J1HJL6_9DIPT|nr:CLUMA_CG001550, isoform A [Clunio marinus]
MKRRTREKWVKARLRSCELIEIMSIVSSEKYRIFKSSNMDVYKKRKYTVVITGDLSTFKNMPWLKKSLPKSQPKKKCLPKAQPTKKSLSKTKTKKQGEPSSSTKK